MSKISVIYATKTRHSQMYAEAIGKALNVKAENVSTGPVLEDVGLLFIVGGIYGGKSLPVLLDYLKGLDKGKVKKAAGDLLRFEKTLPGQCPGAPGRKGNRSAGRNHLPGQFFISAVRSSQ